MGNDEINIGDIVRIPTIKGDFMVVDNSDSALLTVREITAHPGMGKPLKIGRGKVILTHRAVAV